MMRELQALRKWLREQAQAPVDHLSTVHLDELGFERRSLRTIAALGDIFGGGLREVDSIGRSFKFLLVVPLEPTRRLLRPRERELEALMTRLSSMEPPPIYLLRPHQFIGPEFVEEYRLPLALPSASFGEHRAYLRQFRRIEDIEKGWEYNNGIYLEQICWIDSPDGAGQVAV